MSRHTAATLLLVVAVAALAYSIALGSADPGERLGLRLGLSATGFAVGVVANVLVRMRRNELPERKSMDSATLAAWVSAIATAIGAAILTAQWLSE